MQWLAQPGSQAPIRWAAPNLRFQKALPNPLTHLPISLSGAAKGTRTLDIQLGKLTLYQLSYGRLVALGWSDS